MKIDIIIPIYNAFEDLQICLQSIYKHTDLQQNRLILINDNSPDEKIKPYLDKQLNHVNEKTGEKDQIIVIHNETNKGFSNNINLGMAQSQDRDVILLNSDTIVTNRWVEKMVECAYSDDSIGTVTPLSNNATLCSVPYFCEENGLPEGMTVEQAATIVEECSMRKYPRITVAHGFCMLVKREVINSIGNFDAETFGRGYGEENDFCNRAEQMGYIHVMCDDTYIYHSGTKSFVSKEKVAYIREHEQILNKRYPIQMHNNAVHCRDNPNGWVGRNVGYHFDIWNGRKNVLYLLQSDFKEGASDNVGGTQYHVRNLTQELRGVMNIFVAARDREYLQVTAYVGEKEHTFRFFIGDKEPFPMLRKRELAEIFRSILQGFRIDLVHVHHTSTTSLDIFYEADMLGIPIIYTAHDYYYVCPNVTMLDVEGSVCVNQQKPDCTACLQSKKGLYEGNAYLHMWRAKHGEVLQLCRQIVVPSESTKEILGQYYPEQRAKIKVIEHGMDELKLLDVREDEIVYTDDFIWKLEKVNAGTRCPFVAGVAYLKTEPSAKYKVILKITDAQNKTIFFPTNFGNNFELARTENGFSAYLPNGILCDGNITISAVLEKNGIFYSQKGKEVVVKNVIFKREEKLRVAFIGGINAEKGGKTVNEIIKQGDREIEWYVIGGIGEESLTQLHKDNLVKTGYYHQEDVYTYLKYYQIDVVCILSKCPETFSYTLSEAVLSYIPVIVTDIGALGQRVRMQQYGAVVSAIEDKTVAEVLKVLEAWRHKGELYQKVTEKIQNYHPITVQDMTFEYNVLYDAIGEDVTKAEVRVEDIELLYHAYVMGRDGYQGDKALMARVSELENRLKIIDNSITFKIVLMLTGMKIPFKQKIRAWLKK